MPHVRLAALIGGLLLSAAASAQTEPSPTAPTPAFEPLPQPDDARVRIFGRAVLGITMVAEPACADDEPRTVEMVRSKQQLMGAVLGDVPPNISIGMTETDTVRNMRAVMMDKPNYEEHAVLDGQLLRFTGQLVNNTRYRCSSDVHMEFVAQGGHDYEVQMKLEDDMCKLEAREVRADGSLFPVPAYVPPKACGIPATAVAARPDASAPPVSQPFRDWSRVLQISSEITPARGTTPPGDASLRLIKRTDTARTAYKKLQGFSLTKLVTGAVTPFSKEDLSGERIFSAPHPSSNAIVERLQTRLGEYFVAHPERVPYVTTRVQAHGGQWMLSYDTLAGGGPYVLTHDTSISFLSKLGAPSHTVRCTDASRSASLDEWKADNFAKVKAATEEIADECVARYVEKLPTFFPAVAAP